MSTQTNPNESEADDQSNTPSLSTEGRAAFERLYDRYGMDDEVGEIAAAVLQSADSEEETNS